MYFSYKLNKQGDDIQPWGTPFPIWNQSVVSRPVLTVASWPAYRFLKRQIRWSSIPISFRIFHIYVFGFNLQLFCLGSLTQCSWGKLVCHFLFLSMTDFAVTVISSLWCYLSLDSKMPIDLPWALNIFFPVHAYPDADFQPTPASVVCLITSPASKPIHWAPTMPQVLLLALVRRSRGNLKWQSRTSLMVQWIKIWLQMQATWVWSLVWEDPTCHGAAKPVHHKYWGHHA